MKHTRQRRELILSLIHGGPIETQEELAEALREHGVEASQASVSRDIAALGLLKMGGRYVLPPPHSTPQNPLHERIGEYLLAVEPAGDHLLVLKTPPGEASGVALAVDRLDLAGVVGTVAGDDTIFIAVAGLRERVAVSKILRPLLRAAAPVAASVER
jgi:transcriptional regulator of arginine metabolism